MDNNILLSYAKRGSHIYRVRAESVLMPKKYNKSPSTDHDKRQINKPYIYKNENRMHIKKYHGKKHLTYSESLDPNIYS